jgi:hypothetical protein
MQTRHLAALMREDITTVAVFFEQATLNRGPGEGIKRYHYLALREDAAKLKPDMKVLVPSVKGIGVAIVAEVHEEPQIDPDLPHDYQFIIQTIDTARFDAIVEHHAEMQRTLIAVETEVKRRSVLQMYEEAITGNRRLASKFAVLKKGPALPAPAVSKTK